MASRAKLFALRVVSLVVSCAVVVGWAVVDSPASALFFVNFEQREPSYQRFALVYENKPLTPVQKLRFLILFKTLRFIHSPPSLFYLFYHNFYKKYFILRICNDNEKFYINLVLFILKTKKL